jgi:hypothetical protein
MAIRRSSTVTHPADLATTFEATCRALAQQGMSITFADPTSGTIQANSSVSMMSWGEKLELRLSPTSEGTTAVQVGSSLKFGLVDWGKNQKNIDKLNAAIAAALAAGPAAAAVATSPPGAWHPDPAGRHELRWWDGQAWTDAVSDAGVQTSDPI